MYKHSHAGAPKCMHTHCTHELEYRPTERRNQIIGHLETEGRTDAWVPCSQMGNEIDPQGLQGAKEKWQS